ncbi:MAG: triose-phosphate isomerase [Patescibacteria group bacterium]|jgi:triosephosphate isomerase
MKMPIVVANWKMYLNVPESVALAQKLVRAPRLPVTVVVCPSAISISAVADILRGSATSLGAQLVNTAVRGAHTGGVSAADYASLGATYAIVGHSEVRRREGTDVHALREQCLTALANGLTPILCIGETLEQHNEASSILREQYTQVVGSGLPGSFLVAYEPLWAISATSGAHPLLIEDVAESSALLRSFIDDAVPVLYGGSVDQTNAAGFIGAHGFDGVLVGAASTEAVSFQNIIAQVAR